MLVGDQDGVDAVQGFADRGQALAQLQHAEAGVHQDARIFGGQQGGIAGTAAGQHAELDDVATPDSPEYTDSRQNRMGIKCFGRLETPRIM